MSELVPYLCVTDSRAAIDWYKTVFGATSKGKPYVMADGRIGHAELSIGGSRLMMADSFPEVDVEPPDPERGNAVTLHLEVPDCDAVATVNLTAGCRASRRTSSCPANPVAPTIATVYIGKNIYTYASRRMSMQDLLATFALRPVY